MKIYLIGSMQNPRIPEVAEQLRLAGYEVFDEWFSCGPEADDKWQEYCKRRGWNFARALDSWHAHQVFLFDKAHIDAADALVMVAPCGKSGHIELGYAAGSGKPVYVLMEEQPERFDIMYRFATAVCDNVRFLIANLNALETMPASPAMQLRRMLNGG